MKAPCRDWPTGTRVRCVDDGMLTTLRKGEVYHIVSADNRSGTVCLLEFHGRFFADRFKPIVRVKMHRALTIEDWKAAILRGFLQMHEDYAQQQIATERAETAGALSC